MYTQFFSCRYPLYSFKMYVWGNNITIHTEMFLSSVCVACNEMETLGDTGPCLSVSNNK